MDRNTQLTGANLFFLWFGAAVSVAEILAGGYLAELGLVKGMWANVLGHLAGATLLVAAGFIGFSEKLPAIMSTRISFGRQGSYLISAVNILQLVGWTAIMIIQAGTAMSGITKTLWGFGEPVAMYLLTGIAIGGWVFRGVRGFRWINTGAAGLLFLLTIVMTVVILRSPSVAVAGKTGASFGMGFELAIIMPLSWFPLIADYTSLATSKRASLWAPFLGYFIGSTWMYAIGMTGALYAGSPDPTAIMLAANMGVLALCVLALSTVTTTFLDVYSAGISLRNILTGLNDRAAAVAFTAVGTALALVFPIDRYTDFLYILGSVFSPLVAILLTDHFILREDHRAEKANAVAAVSLAAGIAFYYLVKSFDIPIGATLTTIVFTAMLHGTIRKSRRRSPGGGAVRRTTMREDAQPR